MQPFSSFPLFLLLAGLSGCAGFGQGMLVDYDPLKPLDANQLDRHCELEDAAACLLAGKSTLAKSGSIPLIQGMAPTGKAVFSALLSATQASPKWFVFERSTRALTELSPGKQHGREQSPYRLERAEVSGLRPNVDYELILVDANGRYLDHRAFRTFGGAGQGLSFALVSCSDDKFQAEQAQQWKDLAAQNPDLILSIGDNVYADYRDGKKLPSPIDPITLWNRYAETRASLAIFRQPKLIPFFATWDDHDFGMNDGDQTYPFTDAARLTMESFFPTFADAKMVLEGPGVSRALKVSGQTFILFDDRSFRTPNGAPTVCQKNPGHDLCRKKTWANSKEESHFGRIQQEWALRLVAEHNGPVWLISGDQWFGDYHPFESFEGNHPKNFAQFRRELSAAVASAARKNIYPSLVFASGDRHLSEVMKVQPLPDRNYITYEFTSSGIHAYMFPGAWKEFPNPRQIAGESGVMNYSLFQTSLDIEGSLQVEMQALGIGGQKLYEKNFTLNPVINPPRRSR
jgi:alkaline phosphatase D